MEAFTALYDAWPDPALRTRLEEVFRIVRDRMVTTNGSLDLYFQPDWTPVPNRGSFGHEVETASLLAEAASVSASTQNERTWSSGAGSSITRCVQGWDERNGGFFHAGEPEGKVTNARKIWWTQAEGLNALLLMDRQFAREDLRYRDAFLRQWRFIVDCQIDPRNKGWHTEVSAEGAPRPWPKVRASVEGPLSPDESSDEMRPLLRDRTADQSFARLSFPE
jgi:mannobiose 2-epimerase